MKNNEIQILRNVYEKLPNFWTRCLRIVYRNMYTHEAGSDRAGDHSLRRLARRVPAGRRGPRRLRLRAYLSAPAAGRRRGHRRGLRFF